MKNTNSFLLSSRALLLTATAATLALSSTVISKPAFAGSATSDINISATVINDCSIGSGSISFGSYSPLSLAFTSATGNISVQCTNGLTATIKLGQGLNAEGDSTDAAPLRKLVQGTDKLSYSLFQDNTGNTLWGNTDSTGLAGQPHTYFNQKEGERAK